MEIIKQSGSNTVEVAGQIKAALEDIRREMQVGVNVEMVRDNSVNISSSVNNVLSTLIKGSLLATGDLAVGGLVTSTILTLVIVPVIYSLLDDMRSKFSGNKNQ